MFSKGFFIFGLFLLAAFAVSTSNANQDEVTKSCCSEECGCCDWSELGNQLTKF
jgi:hypothetical protein